MSEGTASRQSTVITGLQSTVSGLRSEAVGAGQVQICNDHGNLTRTSRDRGQCHSAVMGGGDIETLRATELGKQFPCSDFVIYNERLHFGQVH
jgi:hypothetical protein